MEHSVTDLKKLPDVAKQLEIGDVIYAAQSGFSESEITYNEFVISSRLSELGADAILDRSFEKYRCKITIVPKGSDSPEIYGMVWYIGGKAWESKDVVIKLAGETLQGVIPLGKIDSHGDIIAKDTKITWTNKTLSIKKGDRVELALGEMGIIIKYPSNKEISVLLDNKITRIVTKEEIKSKVGE